MSMLTNSAQHFAAFSISVALMRDLKSFFFNYFTQKQQLFAWTSLNLEIKQPLHSFDNQSLVCLGSKGVDLSSNLAHETFVLTYKSLIM